MLYSVTEQKRFSILRRRLVERPVEGETFSLFGDEESSGGYFRAVGGLAERALAVMPDIRALIVSVRAAGGSRSRIRRIRSAGDSHPLAALLHDAAETLASYTRAVPGHLDRLPIRQRFDRVIAMHTEQYHLAMLEIELLNRANGHAFRSARRRLAFLPHCLRDFDSDCKAASDGVDEVCGSCSSACWNNAITAFLRASGIEPYIWMSADLPRVFRRILREQGSLGVLGIACIPELVRGMRMCERHGIPAVGLPLNANRCARWTGAFRDNSVNLSELEKLAGASDV